MNLEVYLPEPKSVKEIITGSGLKYLPKGDHIEIPTDIGDKDVKILLFGMV